MTPSPPPQVAAAQYFLNPNATDVNGCTTVVVRLRLQAHTPFLCLSLIPAALYSYSNVPQTAVERIFGSDALSKLSDILPLSQKVRIPLDRAVNEHACLKGVMRVFQCDSKR